MDMYLIFKFLHVASAMMWLGGGLLMVILGVLAQRARDDRRFMDVVGQVALLAKAFFIPISILTLLTGLATVWTGGFGWDAWIILGLAGIAFTAVFGGTVLGPLSEKAVPARNEPAGLAYGKRLMTLAKFDYCVQFAIVWMMIAKPGWTDIDLLAVPAAFIVIGAVLFLRPRNAVTV